MKDIPDDGDIVAWYRVDGTPVIETYARELFGDTVALRLVSKRRIDIVIEVLRHYNTLKSDGPTLDRAALYMVDYGPDPVDWQTGALESSLKFLRKRLQEL